MIKNILRSTEAGLLTAFHSVTLHGVDRCINFTNVAAMGDLYTFWLIDFLIVDACRTDSEEGGGTPLWKR